MNLTRAKSHLADEQITAAGIEVARGSIRHALTNAPGARPMVLSGDRIARCSVEETARFTVTELPKRLGDTVQQGEIVAVIESREVADAKANISRLRVKNALQEKPAARAKTLAETRAMSENEYLRQRGSFRRCPRKARILRARNCLRSA